MGPRHGQTDGRQRDVHRLRQLGTTYSLVDAEPTPTRSVRRIRDGRVKVVTRAAFDGDRRDHHGPDAHRGLVQGPDRTGAGAEHLAQPYRIQ